MKQARGGTLFLDEVGDFEGTLQAKALQLLESRGTPGARNGRGVECRVVAATNRDVRKLIDTGKFREDLYYRLNVVTLTLPPLRERKEDIAILAEHFLGQFAAHRQSAPKQLDTRVVNLLQAYHWPGNVRQLKNTLEGMAVLSEQSVLIEPDLPAAIRSGLPPAGGSSVDRVAVDGRKLEDLERESIMKALEACAGNRTHAAYRVGISVRTLQRKLRQWGTN